LAGRNGAAIFSEVQCREAFHGLGVQDVSGFDCDLCYLLLVGRRKKILKKKENLPGAFFPGLEGRHTLLAVLGGIFTAVRYN
jgi:hypothetical protein